MRPRPHFGKVLDQTKAKAMFIFNTTNYAAIAGATRATGRDSPAARSRGKL